MVHKEPVMRNNGQYTMIMALSIAAIVVAGIFLIYFSLIKVRESPPMSLNIAVGAAVVLEFFDLMALYNPSKLYFWKQFSLITEAFLIPAWFWFAITYARQINSKAQISILNIMLVLSPFFLIFAIAVPIHSLIYSPDFSTEKTLYLSNLGYTFYLFILIYLITSLIQLELTFVHVPQQSRWMLQFELLGAGVFLAVLTLYYSEALLFRTINMHLAPARSAILISAVTLITYSRLKRGICEKVCVSQKMARKSAVVLAVGIYIIGFGLAGEGMKYFGEGFQRAVLITSVLLIGIGLFVVILSESIKRKVTIFIHKNFYQKKYDYRTQWLQFINRLSSSQTSDELLYSVVSEFCGTFGTETGALFILNQERDCYQQTTGIALDSDNISFLANDPVMKHLVTIRDIIDIHNNVDLHRDGPMFNFLMNKSSSFIIPLLINNEVDGFILLGKPLNTHEVYEYEDFDLMRALAKQTSLALSNLRLSEQLACSRELAAIGKISAFVMHDLKNLVVSISLLLENAQEHISVPAFQKDLLTSLRNTVFKMKTIISKLNHIPDKSSLKFDTVDLLQMVQETAALVNRSSVDVTGDHVIAKADREELQKVALNLMLNAVDATQGSSSVKVEVGESETPYIRVRDTGCGIPAVFLQNVLFKPFTSTKKQGMGIGLYQSKQIIEAHGGRIEVVSIINQGSEFTVWLPKMNAEPI